MSGGFDVEPQRLVEFGKHLDQLESNLKETAGVVGGCVADIGIFGMVGQLFGAGASKWCADAERQLNTYAGTIAGFSEKLNEAARRYQDGDAEAEDSITRYQL